MAIQNSPQFPDVKGVDTVKGIAKTGGTIAGYRQVLSMFCKDTKERLQLLRFFLFEGMSENKFPHKHLSSFSTQVHAIRSAAASLGAGEISAEAGRLEEAGKNGDLAFIFENLGVFIEHLSELWDNIRSALTIFPEDPGQEPAEPSGTGIWFSLFGELAKALKSQNVIDIDRILGELSTQPLEPKIKEVVEQLSDQILMTEFASAIKTIEEFSGNKKE